MLSRRRFMQAVTFIAVELGLRSFDVPALTVTPNPATPSTVVAVAGSGFANARTRLLLDGIGATTNTFRPRKDGTFNVGITVSSTAKTQTLAAQQLSGSTWSEVVRTSVVVQAVVVPPPPPPAARPFPAPVTTQTYSVPTTIDKTGATDVAAALNTWLATVPNGSVINFPAGGIYKLGNPGINHTGRSNLIFEGNGATLKPSSPDVTGGSAFRLLNDRDIVIRNFTIIGQNTQPGAYIGAANEDRYGVLMYGGLRIEIANVTMVNIWADNISVAPNSSTGTQVAFESAWIHDSLFTGAGRMGISVISANNVLIERNTFDLTAWVTLDIEPNSDCVQGVNGVIFRDNIVKRGGTNGPEFVSARGAQGSGIRQNITITGNRTDQSLRSDIDYQYNRTKNVVFTNNTAAKSGLIQFAHIDGLTYYGNSLGTYSVSDSTNVVTVP